MEEQAKLICSFSTLTDLDDAKNRSSYPTGVAITPAGNYVIADGGSLKVFDVKGALLNIMTSDKLWTPYDVTVSRSGKIMATDSKSGDIKVFSKHGKYLTTSETGHLLDPRGIHYDLDTYQTCVADRGTSCVYVHDSDGIVTRVLTGKYDPETSTVTSRRQSVGHKSTSTDSDVIMPLQFPSHVTMDTKKNFLVSDSGINAIYCFQGSTGTPMWRYGELGSEDYELLNPAGVCVDHRGNILVADSGNCRYISNFRNT